MVGVTFFLPLCLGTAAAKDKTTAARAHRVPKSSLIFIDEDYSLFTPLLHINMSLYLRAACPTNPRGTYGPPATRCYLLSAAAARWVM